MAQRLLVVATHPDDETLGAGGSLLAAKHAGHEIGWLIVTHMSEEYGWEPERVASRNAEIETVRNAYGFDYFRNLALEPAGLDRHPFSSLVTQLRGALDDWEPHVVVAPFWADAHSDHQVVFKGPKACLKKFRAGYLRRFYAMEVVSETNYAYPTAFSPTCFADVTQHFERKVEILKIYASEVHEHPFPRSPRSLRALATLRGAEANCEYAEAFELVAAYDGLI